MRNLKSDSNLPSKKESPSDSVSFMGDDTGSFKESDMDHETVATDQGMPNPAGSYSGYYFPGYDRSFGELDDQGYYVGGDGMELQYPVMQADNGSLIYFMPGFQPVYNPYSPFIPVATIGVDGQSVGQQTYAPNPMFQLPMAFPGYFLAPFPYGESVPSPYVWDPSSPIVDGPYGNGYSGVLEIPGSKHNLSSANHVPPHSESFLPSDFSNPLEVKSTLASLDVPSGHVIRNQSRPVNKASQHGSMVQSDVLAKGYFPAAKFQSYNQGKGGMLYSNSPVNYKANSRGLVGTEKLKTRNKANENGEFGLLSEQNNSSRTANVQGAVVSGGYAVGSPTDENGNSNSITSIIRRDQYNLADFPTTYDHAFFFVIKSYSEDDVHKSIKYNVWASTPNGNKRLDTAFQDAQKRVAEKGCKCPVFLFFSVNASGQFCGVAEMVGRVDFDKSMDFWQQDKWNGYFQVKWHIIKDVPNPQLRHIILENNDNKPVTNSRDTQEVKFPQGIEILNIFKNYISKTSILDDFYFYESRQKVMQERRIKPSTPHFDNPQKVDELIFRFHSVDLSSVKNIEEPWVRDRAEK